MTREYLIKKDLLLTCADFFIIWMKSRVENLQFDTKLCMIYAIDTEKYSNTPNLTLARLKFPPPFANLHFAKLTQKNLQFTHPSFYQTYIF